MVALTAVADLAAQALKEASTQIQQNPPPPLPTGWILKESRSQPNMHYYYNQETGESSWNPPISLITPEEDGREEEENRQRAVFELNNPSFSAEQKQKQNTIKGDVESSRKRSNEDTNSPASSSSNKRTALKAEDAKLERSHHHHHHEPKPSQSPKEVRVLHILKKHKDSRRPSSWRSNNNKITITRDEAVAELQSLLEILLEEASNPENLIATFKELASQESDCSSAKRHGDLGFFGRKKMRPEFEEAAFGLDINQLSGIVETASGAHILLRLE